MFHDKLVFRTGAGMFHGRDAISQTSALGQLPPFDRTATLTGVTLSSLTAFNPNLPQPPTTLQTLEPNYDNPLSYQYSAGIQYSITGDTLLGIGYAGSHQIHQGLNVDVNQVPYSDLLSVYQYENSGGSVVSTLTRCAPILGSAIFT